jgi:hypothetical protein
VSRSGSYFNLPKLPVVSDAVVIITDNFGIIDTLHQTVPGTYLTRRTRGVPGRTYKLSVLADGKEYTATSTMPYHVNIDSMKLLKSELSHFTVGSQTEEIRHEIRIYFRDPVEKNFYRVKVVQNDSVNTQNYRLYDDQYTNGQETELRATYAEAGNTYRIELLSLDRSTYLYYRTLADLLYSNPFFGSTPANPTSNISNGALGYFGTCTISSRTVTITKDMLGTGSQ